MTTRAALRCTLTFFAALLLSVSANAQLFRAYLAPTGSDSNPCTLPAPCRLLPAALAAVADGGEIWMLDSANYNTATVNITKSVTILAVPGALGSVLATGGPAINIATADVKVALRNLVIVPLPGGSATEGINMTNGAMLTIESCVVANMPGDGIKVVGNTRVRVSDSTIRDSSLSGLNVQNGVRAAITRSSFMGNGFMGVWAIGSSASTTTAVDVSDSTANGNGLGGIRASSSNATAAVSVGVRSSSLVQNYPQGGLAQSTAGGLASLSIGSSLISNNLEGVIATGTGAKVWVSGNILSGNGTGLWNYGGGALVETAGDNAMRNNEADTNGTITVVATK